MHNRRIRFVWLRRLKYQSLTILYVLALSASPLSILLSAQTTHADAPYLASDVLGQTDPESGDPSFTTNAADNMHALPDSLNGPESTTIDTTHHRLFVADRNNSRVLIYNLANDNTLQDTTPDNVLGQADFYDSTYRTTAGGLRFPQGLAYDTTNDRLFVADNSDRIVVYDTTVVTNGEDAINVLGQADFTTRGSHISAKGFSSPGALAYDTANNHLFVSDSGNLRVLVFDTTIITNNEDAINVLGQANFTSSTADTNAKGFSYYPNGLAYDAANNRLFASDNSNYRVLIFDVTTITNNEDAVNVLGQSDFTSNTNDTNAKGFFSPQGVTYDAANNRLFVADRDNSRVLIFDVTAITNNEDAVNVLGEPDFTSNTQDTNTKGFQSPVATAFDATNNRLFVADTGNSRVLIFDVTAITNNEDAIEVIGQADSNGDPTFTTGYANNTQAPNNTGFYNPYGTVLDTVHHRLFASDSNNCRILIFNLDSSNNLLDHTADKVLGQFNFNTHDCAAGAAGMGTPGGLAYDSTNDRLFAADLGDNYRVLVFDTATITNGEDAINVLGQPDFDTTDSGLDQNSFADSYKGGLVYDPTTDRLYVSDGYSNCRVMVFDVATITDGENAVKVLGQPDFDTNDCETDQASLYNDTSGGLAIDSAHQRLFVSDYSNYRVMVFDVNSITNGENAVNVLGQPDFDTTDCCDITQAEVGNPTALTYDPTNQQLFVQDYYNYRVMVFDVASITNGENAIGALGPTDFETSSGYSNPPTQSSFNLDGYEGSMAFDSGNRRLYVPDAANNRVMIFDLANITTDSLPSGSTGSAYSKTLDFSGTQGTESWSLTSGSLPPGITFNAGSHTLTGTSTTTGSYTFTIQLSDDNGDIGSFTDSQSYTLNISNVSAATEDAAPNGGDANNDGTADSSQDNVTSFVDPVTGQYAVLETSCDANTDVSAAAESANSTQDPAFNYPVGLIAFTSTGCPTGGDVTITQYFYTKSTIDPSQVVQRKYDDTVNPKTYTTIPGAIATNLTIASKPVLKITYHMTEGGSLDLDHLTNSSLTDPSGPAINSAGVPNTGVGRGR